MVCGRAPTRLSLSLDDLWNPNLALDGDAFATEVLDAWGGWVGLVVVGEEKVGAGRTLGRVVATPTASHRIPLHPTPFPPRSPVVQRSARTPPPTPSLAAASPIGIRCSSAGTFLPGNQRKYFKRPASHHHSPTHLPSRPPAHTLTQPLTYKHTHVFPRNYSLIGT